MNSRQWLCACTAAAEGAVTGAAVPEGNNASKKAAAAASAAGVVAQQGQAAATVEASRPAVAEEDISKWIQLPRQGSKGRAAHKAPSAEEPWQVQSVLCCAVLCCRRTTAEASCSA